MSEFDLIEAIRARAGFARDDVLLGIGDDAAVLEVPAARRLVACTDTLVAGVHFPVDTAPEDIGWKSLAVNLSDLAAMGADPAWALLALALPKADARFVERFADGLAELASRHRVALVGGDTVQGPLTVTVTALGTVPVAGERKRCGAHAGDAVYVTGTLGDAAGGLRLLRDRKHAADRPGEGARVELLRRLYRPEPRVAAGLALRGVASACIDVSDGLSADLGHVCDASGVGAELDAGALPVSTALEAAFDAATRRELALSGGDDYELCFTAPEDRAGGIDAAFAALDLRVTRIGRIVAGSGVRALDASGRVIDVPNPGWEHFSG